MNDEFVYDLRKKYVKEMDEIKNEIIQFNRKQKRNFCSDCLKSKDWHKEYESKSFETFICDGCGDIKEVLNITIAKLVEDRGISVKDYVTIGGPKIYFNDKFNLWLK